MVIVFALEISAFEDSVVDFAQAVAESEQIQLIVHLLAAVNQDIQTELWNEITLDRRNWFM